jgi:RNA polymerase sigma-70 factor (ECF subfamily)
MADGLLPRFLTALAPEEQPRFAAWAGLELALADAWNRACAEHGAALCSGDRFADHLAAHVDRDAEPEQALENVFAGDLMLACACADGDAAALGVFEKNYGRDIDLALVRAGDIGMSRDEFRQRVRERLFVATAGRQVRIAGYGGRGSLRSWVRVTATRTMLDIVRKPAEPQNRSADDAGLFERLPDRADPELDYMRQAYGAAVPEAMQAAFAGLTSRQRNLLRQRYLHDMSTERIATMYNVHRATAFRWLEDARVALWNGVRTALMEKLRVGEPELDSVLALLASRIDVSVRRILDSRLEDG